MPITKYDDSGQVYTETSCRAGPMTSEWEWKTRGSVIKHATYRSPGPGCSSLSAMATRSFLLHSPSLTPASLANLPQKFTNTLWTQLQSSRLDSVRVWKCFATTHPFLLLPPPLPPPSHPFPSPPKKLHLINHPDVPLHLYITPLTSPAGKWLTILTLQSIHCTRSDLIVQLARLTNLACLTLAEDLVVDSRPGIDDAVVRAWSDHAAANTNAWGMLRVLTLRLQPQITIRSFRYLPALPMLRVVNVSDCGISLTQRKEIRELGGWRCHSARNDAGVETQMSVAGGRCVWDEMADRSLALARSVVGDGARQGRAEKLDGLLPRLHLALGRNYIGPGEGRDGYIVGRKKMTFVRTSTLPSSGGGVKKEGEAAVAAAIQKQRCNDEGVVPGKDLPPRKRPTLRKNDQQQDLSNSFLEMFK